MRALRPEVAAVLVCPRCRCELDFEPVILRCRAGHHFPVVDGVPVFTAAGRNVEQRPANHTSHQAPDAAIARVSGAGRPWVHLGAGATAARHDGSIELETAIFANTDIVGDARSLPFRSGSLSGALALNVFEHLADPEGAGRELRRVLRPGGVVVIQSAFLQPLHGDPQHFFNVTEAGLRRWFRAFEVEDVTVPENFNPVYALSWICSELLHRAGAEVDGDLANVTVGELARIWRDESARRGKLYDAFLALPDGAQRALAAGFQLTARRPSG